MCPQAVYDGLKHFHYITFSYICKDICSFDVQHYNRCETKGVEKTIENVRKKLPHPN